ncbi:MAG: transcription antitermination factor NusB [Pseudomonadota bacterium]
MSGKPSHPPRGDAQRAGLDSRRYAVTLASAVLDQGVFLDDAMSARAEQRSKLAPRDRAFAHAVLLALFRGLGRIDAEIDARLSKPLPENATRVRNILRIAAAEMVFLETPAYAAVDAAVRMAKRSDPRFSGLVNAISRRLGEAAADIRTKPTVTAAWFEKALVSDWGAETAARIQEAHQQPPPIDLSLRAEETAAALAQELDAEALPTGGLRLRSSGAVTALPGFEEGAWWVQDAAAALPAKILVETTAPRAKVLDLCAAPGGKTLQLAAGGAEVTALDVSDKRLARLRENLKRTGLRADIRSEDALSWAPSTLFDAVLLDAPCSASGTVRRHPELPWIKSLAGLRDLVTLQDNLLDAAWRMLRPGGVLVYCTCSLFKAEGEDRAAAFLDRTDDARTRRIAADRFGVPEAICDGGWLRLTPALWTDRGGMDGFFVARFEKQASTA